MRNFLPVLFALFALVSGETKPNIAVIDLTGSGLSPSDLVTLSNRLRTELFETQKFIVVERGQMETILKEQGFQQTGCTDAACAVEAGQLLNVDRIIVGSIDKISRVYSINLRAVSVKDGSIVQNVKNDLVDAEIEDLMLRGLRKAARCLAGLDTTEEIATPAALRGRKVVKYKGTQSGPAGSLNIIVKPGDAEIFVDDSAYGTGSMVIDYVPVGEHKVKVERRDYRKIKEKAEVFRNQETALNLALDLRTPFVGSVGWSFFFKKTLIQRSLVYSRYDTTLKTISLDLDHTSDMPRVPAFSLGWNLGRNYFGLSGWVFPGFNYEVVYLNADKDTFPFDAESPTFGGLAEFQRALVDIPGIFSAGPGFSLGYLIHKEVLHDRGGGAHGADGNGYTSNYGDNVIGREYLFFGGPQVFVKAGYKHIFIVVTDRLLMGIKRDISYADAAAGAFSANLSEVHTNTGPAMQNTLMAVLRWPY